ncbi:sugar phosphate isomerase/epimerase and 4-hydroxyphenylpyruvate domain-containing protein [Nocardioides insulae]|uniref:sugar phosphate isomerase/epimerase and 4-hydroxyphenylpyruvate domain-containing protein n=1 Tax=Nocardioides insulae TaxID=394734 RepID=UPI0004123AAC|nr:sugar phosphate isomerase/epimerase and 4-hydroxyphenylpyruvate domain-containing protein [Nocardioides insulae]
MSVTPSPRLRRAIATVCLSGSLEEKLTACAEAGFDGVEIFEQDLVVSDLSPEEVRARADRLGLTIDLYQPFRDFEGVDEEQLADNLRRAEERFKVMKRLGADLILVCSNVATATVDSDEVSAAQLRQLGDLAEKYDVRIAFEALAWGRFVNDYRRAWRIVELADHPRVGTCLDSFHILSRGHDPAEIERIPGDKIFFVQLADAPALSMDVLSWSRHHRLFPGEGDFELGGFVAHLSRAGYTGPLSLEVFNDVFRQTDTQRTAHHAMRSLGWVEDQAARVVGADQQAPTLPPTRLPRAGSACGYDYVEVKAENTSEVEAALYQLGLTFRGRHRTKPVRLWSAGDIRVVLNEEHAIGEEPHLAGVGFTMPSAATATERARALSAQPVTRRTHADEQRLDGFDSPNGMEVFFNDPVEPGEPGWVAEFLHGNEADAATPYSRIDHINLVHPWDAHDEAVLFYTSVLGLEAPPPVEVASPQGLVRSQVMRSADGSVRLPLNVAPALSRHYPEHVALACDDIVAVARRARERGMKLLRIPANYYDDLRARFGLPDEQLDLLRRHDLLLDRDAHGEFWHFYTARLGRVFFEVVQRVDGYDGYGADNAPVRLAAQQRRDGRS